MKRFCLCIVAVLGCLLLRAESSTLDFVLRDICETLIEQDPTIDIEWIEEQLLDISRNPIDLNTATSDDLEKLFFLSPDQVDALLLYVYHHPMTTIYELNLVPGLRDYEIRNMLPFVCVIPTERKDERTMRDLMKSAGHEIDLRVDARNLENFAGDPVYASLKYKMNAGNKILLGATVKRDAGEIMTEKSRYGAYLRVNDIWKIKSLIMGDYRAQFGLGLVMNSAMPLGKSAYASSLGMMKQGINHYNGTSDDFMRGVATTMRFGGVDVSAFYSYRNPDSLYRQTAGANITYSHNRLRVGLTAVDYWTQDSLPYSATYYNGNYFRGTNQLSLSANAQYAWRRCYMFAEVAAAQNTQWGWAALAGVRYSPVQDVSLLALYRYYSPTYDAIYASTFSETTKANDEQGGYIGAEVKRVKDWKFSLYTDFFAFSGPKYTIRNKSWGYDIFGLVEYKCARSVDMCMRARAKRKGEKDTYSLRYMLNAGVGDFMFRTQIDANICRSDTQLTYGAQIGQQIEYAPSSVPFTAQMRVEGFYIPAWNNRIYTYENDVLYAFSIPSSYGIGVRYYMNMRYRISDHYSLYLKASDTWYTKKWAERQSLASCHKTDIHLLLRITY